MGAQTRRKTGNRNTKSIPASLVWFEVSAENVERAKKFYGSLFGWKFEKLPGPMEYWHIETGGADASPDGGLMARCHPRQTITNYVNVPSVSKFMAKVEKLGGKVHRPRMAVPQRGYFAMCEDTENNTFAIWETNRRAR